MSVWLLHGAWQQLCLHAWRKHKNSIVALRYYETYWELKLKCGRKIASQIEQNSCCFSKCLILNWRSISDKKLYTLILTPDCLQIFDFGYLRSQLLVKLRI